MPRRSLWKASFLDAFLLRKFFFDFILQLRMSLRPPAPFLKTFFCCAPISKGRGCRLSCGSNCELIPFLFWGFVPSFCGWEASSSAPPYSPQHLYYKKALSPTLNIISINKNRACLRTGGIAQSYLSLKSVWSGRNFYSKFRLNSDHLAVGV